METYFWSRPQLRHNRKNPSKMATPPPPPDTKEGFWDTKNMMSSHGGSIYYEWSDRDDPGMTTGALPSHDVTESLGGEQEEVSNGRHTRSSASQQVDAEEN